MLGNQLHEVLGQGRLRRRWRANVRERWLGASDRQRQGYSASQQQVVNHCGAWQSAMHWRWFRRFPSAVKTAGVLGSACQSHAKAARRTAAR